MRRATTAKVCLDLAKSARLTVPGAINHRLQSPFARTEHDLLLPKPVKGTILAPKTAGIWRMSAYTPSAPGTTLNSAPGCVTTLEGVWCNGSCGATWQLFLNGLFMSAADPTSRFSSLAVSCNGNIFVKDWVTANWAAVLSFNKYVTNSSVLPTCPIPTVVTTTPNPAFVTAPVPGPQISSSTTVGSVIATAAVVTSDGSPFSGTLALATNPDASAFLGMSGANIVTTGTPTPAQAYNVEVHATEGGLTAWPGASTIELIVH